MQPIASPRTSRAMMAINIFKLALIKSVKPRLLCSKRYGIGSYPPPDHGLHLIKRKMVNQHPLSTPYFVIA